MALMGVRVEVPTNQPIVLLREEGGTRYLPIFIGPPEATAIVYALQGMDTPRPMTHDLFTEMLTQLDAKVVRIAVTELRDNTFYAMITIAVDGTEIEVDSRPSDAIALAVRADTPIFAAPEVIEESAIEFEQTEEATDEELLEQFKEFLDEVKPDDFFEAEGEAEPEEEI